MILFRSDIDPASGAVTFNRSVYLAALLRRMTTVVFCCGDKTISSWLKSRKFSAVPPLEVMSRQHKGPVTLVFDVDNFSARDQELLTWAKENAFRTVHITDLGLNRQPVDLTIDGSLRPMIADDPEKTGLFGPEYMILHTKFRHFHRLKKPLSQTVKNLFLCPGGYLSYRKLSKWVEGLVNHGYRLKIFPGTGLKKSHRKILKRKFPVLKFVGRVESRARPFYEADLALVPPDRSAYEAAACGTPALYFCTGPAHEFQAEGFQKRGCGLRIPSDDVTPECLDLIKSLNLSRREEMARKGKETVDGRGVYRIIDFFKKHAII